MKCEGCPLDEPTEEFSPNDYNGGNFYTQHGCELIDDCHLTPSDMTAIIEAIAGEGRLVLVNKDCWTCQWFSFVSYLRRCMKDGIEHSSPCDKWEVRQDQGGE